MVLLVLSSNCRAFRTGDHTFFLLKVCYFLTYLFQIDFFGSVSFSSQLTIESYMLFDICGFCFCSLSILFAWVIFCFLGTISILPISLFKIYLFHLHPITFFPAFFISFSLICSSLQQDYGPNLCWQLEESSWLLSFSWRVVWQECLSFGRISSLLGFFMCIGLFSSS
jgi:hypothetical protein